MKNLNPWYMTHHLDKVDHMVKKKAVPTHHIKYQDLPLNAAKQMVRNPQKAKRQAQFKLDITGHKRHEY